MQNNQEASGEPRRDGKPERANNGRFLKRDTRVSQSQNKEPEEDAIDQEAAQEDVDPAEFHEEGVPQQLADMRWVYEQPPATDRTQGHRTCRKWLKDDTKGFMGAMTKLENDLSAARLAKNKLESSGKPAEPEHDIGVEKCVALAEKLLREIGDAGTPAQ